MKKTLCVFLLLGLLTNAQAQDIPFIDFGLKAGINSSWVRSLPDGQENDGQFIGPTGGIWARVKIPGIGIFVQGEALISRTGGDISTSGVIAEYRQTQIDFPILVGQKFNLGPLGLRALVGPVFTRVLNAELSEIDLKDLGVSNESQFSLQVGIGADFSRFSVDARYQHGFSNIYEDSFATDINGNTVSEIETKGSSFQVTLGYKIF
ncbi:MAG: porin family protein [Bacteroidota bacterium]